MNKLFFTSLILIVFLSIGAVCADDADMDLTALNSIDASYLAYGDDLPTAESGENVLSENEDSTFTSLNSIILSGSSEINLTRDYAFNEETDEDFIQGIGIVDKTLVINGNNHIIDAKNQAKIFFIGGSNVTINNITFINANNCAMLSSSALNTNNVNFINCTFEMGAALNMGNSSYVSRNDNFIDNFASQSGAAIYSDESDITIENDLFKSDHVLSWSMISLISSSLQVVNTTFANTTSKYATAIYSENSNSGIKKSKFVNLFSNRTAGAIGFKEDNNATIEDCEFINVSSDKNGGAVFADFNDGNGTISISNTLFEDCSSEFGGAYLQLGGELGLFDSNFTRNSAEFSGGAVYLSNTFAEIDKCIFDSNTLDTTYEDYPIYGGAIFSDLTSLSVTNSKFEDNKAIYGSAIYCYDSDYYLGDLELNGNGNHAVCTFFDQDSEIENLYGTDVITEDDFNNTYYPSVVVGKGMELELLDSTPDTGELPARYDLREEGLVTPVKNQGRMGACWAFGMDGSLESVLLKAANYTADFSENSMQNAMLVYSPYAFRTLFGSAPLEGGFNVMSTAYLVSWLGAFPQDADSYDELGKISPIMTTDNDIHIQDVLLVPHVPGDSMSIENIKKLIYNFGALVGYLESKDTADDGTPTDYYNENTSAEYVPILNYPNHAIAVAGWDDNFAKENFLYQPPGDGAWIIKNSWGSNWADDGYFYVSYYDKTLCAIPDALFDRFAQPIIINTNPYNKNYQYDFSGLSDFFTSETPVIYSNGYESEGDDLIAAVGTYFDEPDLEYTVMIEVNDEDVYNQSGISPFAGYHTIPLDNYVAIKKGDEFRVSIISKEVPLSRGSRVHYKSGSSLLAFSNNTYEDLSESGIVACLKAYTLEDDSFMIPLSDVSKEYEPGSLFSVKVVTSDGHPVCAALVKFTIADMTYEVMTDGEGIAVFQIPELNPGNYTLTVAYKNQTVEVAVHVNETDGNVPQEDGHDAGADSNISLHPTGNPILMMVLSLVSVFGLSLKRRIF